MKLLLPQSRRSAVPKSNKNESDRGYWTNVRKRGTRAGVYAVFATLKERDINVCITSGLRDLKCLVVQGDEN